MRVEHRRSRLFLSEVALTLSLAMCVIVLWLCSSCHIFLCNCLPFRVACNTLYVLLLSWWSAGPDPGVGGNKCVAADTLQYMGLCTGIGSDVARMWFWEGAAG